MLVNYDSLCIAHMAAHSTRTNSLHIAIFIEGCFTVIVVVKFEPVILQICLQRIRRTNRHAHSNTMLPYRVILSVLYSMSSVGGVLISLT